MKITRLRGVLPVRRGVQRLIAWENLGIYPNTPPLLFPLRTVDLVVAEVEGGGGIGKGSTTQPTANTILAITTGLAETDRPVALKSLRMIFQGAELPELSLQLISLGFPSRIIFRNLQIQIQLRHFLWEHKYPWE